MGQTAHDLGNGYRLWVGSDLDVTIERTDPSGYRSAAEVPPSLLLAIVGDEVRSQRIAALENAESWQVLGFSKDPT